VHAAPVVATAHWPWEQFPEQHWSPDVQLCPGSLHAQKPALQSPEQQSDADWHCCAIGAQLQLPLSQELEQQSEPLPQLPPTP
jgi:hypothetical protein